jgi:membrane protease YdiL (CAAX protease family)
MTDKSQRRAIIVYFAIAFGVPWIGWTIRWLLDLDPTTLQARLLFYTGDFCSIGGLVAACVLAGKAGLKDMWRRFVLWRIPLIWWLAALFLPAVWSLLSVIGFGISRGGIGTFDPAGITRALTPGVLIALTTGPLGEEFGWRGFLLPQFLKRFTPLVASLIIGVIWGIWHFALYHTGVMSTFEGILRFTATTVLFSLIMTVLFLKTKTSILIAVAIHWTINIMPGIVQSMFPTLITPDSRLAFSGVWQLIAIAFVTAFIVIRHWGLLTQKQETS